jgi:hypothetical protein
MILSDPIAISTEEISPTRGSPGLTMTARNILNSVLSAILLTDLSRVILTKYPGKKTLPMNGFQTESPGYLKSIGNAFGAG